MTSSGTSTAVSFSLPLTTNPIHTIMGDIGQGGRTGEADDVQGQGHGDHNHCHEDGARAVDDQSEQQPQHTVEGAKVGR